MTLVAVVASATVCGAASGRPSQTTSTPPAGTKYISKLYGYSIVLRGKYLWIPAQQQWDGQFSFIDTEMVDLLAGVYRGKDHKFVIAAEPVAADMTLSQWATIVEGVQQSYCSGLRTFRDSSLGGEPAQEFVNTCPGPSPGSTWRVITLAALHNGRGYVLDYLSNSTSKAGPARRYYDAERSTFRFTQ